MSKLDHFFFIMFRISSSSNAMEYAFSNYFFSELEMYIGIFIYSYFTYY